MCKERSIAWLGPTPEHVEPLGPAESAITYSRIDSVAASERQQKLAAAAGISRLPRSQQIHSFEDAAGAATQIGYLVAISAVTAVTSWYWISQCSNIECLKWCYDYIGQIKWPPGVLLASLTISKYTGKSKLVLVQVFGDGKGHAIALGDQLSLRWNKSLGEEETPSVDTESCSSTLTEAMHSEIRRNAVQIAKFIHYRGAATVHFWYDESRHEYFFARMETSVLEPPENEELSLKINLVEWTVKQASGELSALDELERYLSRSTDA